MWLVFRGGCFKLGCLLVCGRLLWVWGLFNSLLVCIGWLADLFVVGFVVLLWIGGFNCFPLVYYSLPVWYLSGWLL